MTFLKNLAVSLLGFILFLSLSTFGIVYTVKHTALNADFVIEELNNLKLANLFGEIVQVPEQPNFPDLNVKINDALTQIEPELKSQTSSFIRSVYSYIQGDNQELKLSPALRQTLLSDDFVESLINSIDLAYIAESAISDQLTTALPFTIPDYEKHLSAALKAAEPALKQQATSAAGQVVEYILGERSSLNATISFEPVLAELKNVVFPILMDSPPPELAALPKDIREAQLNNLYNDIVSSVPSFPIDEKIISRQTRADIQNELANADDGLAKAKEYYGLFDLVYFGLLGIIAISALGMILLLRNVKGITREIGIPLATFGAIEYGGIQISKYFINKDAINIPNVPSDIMAWLNQLTLDVMKPLEVFSLTVLIVGILLIAFSIIYGRTQEPATT